jgi:hypothetical protein
MKNYFLSGLLVWNVFATPLFLNAQTSTIDAMQKWRKETLKEISDAEKNSANDSLRHYVEVFLNEKTSFSNPIKIDFMGDLPSPDGEIRMLTWNLSLSDGTYSYFCYIQKKPFASGNSNWYELNDQHKSVVRPEFKTLKSNQWYGCLYYQIIPVKVNKEIGYTLLGWEGNSPISNKKLIDFVDFNSKGEPVFGKSIFESDNQMKRRVIFEYTKEAYFMLKYDPDEEFIIFNRLEPLKPELEGIYSYYTPIMTYDAYTFKKNKWVLEMDIQPKNPKTNQIYNNPQKAPKPPKAPKSKN